MKIIFSRKGFDTGAGGCASPIFSDGSMISLPIPDPSAQVTYSQINTFAGVNNLAASHGNLGAIVSDLTYSRRTKTSRYTGISAAHLDPDLNVHALTGRFPGWLPAFGPLDRACTHLSNQGVGLGDIFLFFGWFHEVEQNSKLTFAKAADLHVIFGWLQIGGIIDVTLLGVANVLSQYPWLKDHPHVNSTGSSTGKNVIYIATENLTLPSGEKTGRPGSGVFADGIGATAGGINYSHNRILTHPNQKNRSVWRLPDGFAPPHATLTHNPKVTKKGEIWLPSQFQGCVMLKTIKGQEFVLDVKTPHCQQCRNNWLNNIF